MRFNPCFCRDKKKGFEYCYYSCKKNRCPTLSNFWYGYIVIPLQLFRWAILNKFTKCDKLPTNCSFLFCKKYCALKNKCR